MKQAYLLFLSLFVIGMFSSCVNGDVFLVENSGSGVSGSITKFAVYNDYMYVLNPNQVLTYSLEDEDNPVLLNTTETEYGLETIFIYDEAIYLGSVSSLYILDITEPSTPIILSKTDRSMEFFNGCDPVVVQESHAYSTVKILRNICGSINSRSALIVFDVTNKRRPLEVGAYNLSEPNGLGLHKNHLFICDAGTDQVRVFDISDPRELIELSLASFNVTNPVDVLIDGNTLIVSAQTYFEIYNIEDVNDIYKVGEIKK